MRFNVLIGTCVYGPSSAEQTATEPLDRGGTKLKGPQTPLQLVVSELINYLHTDRL